MFLIYATPFLKSLKDIDVLHFIQKVRHRKSADPIAIRPQVSPNTYCTNEQIRLRFVIL